MEAMAAATNVRHLTGAQAIPGLRRWTWCVFFLVLLAELAGAYVLIYPRGYILADAVSRTANAYYVLNIIPNKLASIGFVWNPLPSLLQLPILAFKDWWRPLATSGLAGCIVTAVFAAINAALLFRYFRLGGNRVWLSLLIVALYAFNPFIFYYGCNGMSETIFFTALVMGTHNFAMWTEDRATGRLLAVALMLGVGFLTRYETLALVLGFAAALLVAVYLMEDRQSPFRHKPAGMKRDYAVGTATVLFTPVLYAILVWMFLSLTIMGDPIFFLRSAYSNEAQSLVTAMTEYRIHDMSGRFLEAGKYTVVHLLPFLPVLLVIAFERMATKRLERPDMLILALLVGSVVGFHYLLLILGRSFGWLRFFSYALPICLAWLPYELSGLRAGSRSRSFTAAGLCVALAVSAALIPVYFSNRDLAREEYGTFHLGASSESAMQLDMAKRINAKYGGATILFDSFIGSTLILNLDHPENLITTTSDDFMAAVKDPRGFGVEYIIVTLPEGPGLLDAINREYPDFFYNGAPWAELVESNDWYRVYKIIPW